MSRTSGFLPSGKLFGTALVKKEGIENMTLADLSPLIAEELGFDREYDLFKKKIKAAKDPEDYIEKRRDRQDELAFSIAKFVQDYAKTLRSAGFTVDETGMIARHVAKTLGDIMRIPLEVEYPTEFVRKGLEDYLKMRYR